MIIQIHGTPEEIAALAVAVQKRQIMIPLELDVKAIAQAIRDTFEGTKEQC